MVPNHGGSTLYDTFVALIAYWSCAEIPVLYIVGRSRHDITTRIDLIGRRLYFWCIVGGTGWWWMCRCWRRLDRHYISPGSQFLGVGYRFCFLITFTVQPYVCHDGTWFWLLGLAVLLVGVSWCPSCSWWSNVAWKASVWRPVTFVQTNVFSCIMHDTASERTVTSRTVTGLVWWLRKHAHENVWICSVRFCFICLQEVVLSLSTSCNFGSFSCLGDSRPGFMHFRQPCLYCEWVQIHYKEGGQKHCCSFIHPACNTCQLEDTHNSNHGD